MVGWLVASAFLVVSLLPAIFLTAVLAMLGSAIYPPVAAPREFPRQAVFGWSVVAATVASLLALAGR